MLHHSDFYILSCTNISIDSNLLAEFHHNIFGGCRCFLILTAKVITDQLAAGIGKSQIDATKNCLSFAETVSNHRWRTILVKIQHVTITIPESFCKTVAGNVVALRAVKYCQLCTPKQIILICTKNLSKAVSRNLIGHLKGFIEQAEGMLRKYDTAIFYIATQFIGKVRINGNGRGQDDQLVAA